MLVLTRKTLERIQVGHDIEITVISIRDGTVRIGISAPRRVRILRSELCTELPKRPPLESFRQRDIDLPSGEMPMNPLEPT